MLSACCEAVRGVPILLTYDVGQQMCFANRHAHARVMLHVQEVHMQVVVAGLVVQVHPELLRCYCMPGCDRLHETDASLGSVDLRMTRTHHCA